MIDHICPDLQEFEDFESLDDSDNTITIPDGRKIKVLHRGTIRLSDNIVLQQVLHVPDFQYKLISVHKLCKDMNIKLIFNDTQCIIQDHLQKDRSETWQKTRQTG